MFTFTANLEWPMFLNTQMISPDDAKGAVTHQIEGTLSREYLSVRAENASTVLVAFDHARWLNESIFTNPNKEISVPNRIVVRFRKMLPTFLMAHAPWNILGKFVLDSFRKELPNHRTAIFGGIGELLTAIVASRSVEDHWFNMHIDLQCNTISLNLKIGAIVKLAAGVLIWRELAAG